MLTEKYTLKSVLESQKNAVKHFSIQKQREQKEHLNDLQSSDTCITQIDFAEAYPCELEKETQWCNWGGGYKWCVHRPEKIALFRKCLFQLRPFFNERNIISVLKEKGLTSVNYKFFYVTKL